MSVQYNFKIFIDQIEGLDVGNTEGKKVYIEWKRGSKKQNTGKTERMNAKNGAVVGLGEIQLKTTLHTSSSKKGSSYDPKYLSLTVRRLDEAASAEVGTDSPSSSGTKKRRLKASTIGKALLDLSTFVDVLEKKDKVRLSKSHATIHFTITSTPISSSSSSSSSPLNEQSSSSSTHKNNVAKEDIDGLEKSDSSISSSSDHYTPTPLKSKSGSRLFSTSSSKLFGGSSKSKKSSSKSGGSRHGSRSSSSSSSSSKKSTEAGGDNDGSDEELSYSDRSFADSSAADDTTAGDWSDEDQLGEAFNQHATDDDREVPLIIQDMVHLLSQSSALSIQGLFQMTASPAVIDVVINMYKSGVAVSEDWTDFTAAANVLKTVLSTRPDPLIPTSLLPNFLEALKKPSLDEKLTAFRTLLTALPPKIYVLLAFVTELLWKIVLSPANRISSHNVATIFLEAYFRQESDTIELKKKFEQMQRAVELVELLVQNFDKVFTPVNLPEHHAKRLLPAQFMAAENPTDPLANSALKKTHKRGSSLSLLTGSPQGKPVKYEFRLIFKGLHDLMPVDQSAKTPYRVLLRWRRGKKSKNQGQTSALEMDGSQIVNFPPDTATAFKVSLFRNPKGYFCSKSIDFEIVYEKEGKPTAVMSGALDLADAINALEASGEDTAVLSTETVVSFPSLISVKSPPTKLLVTIRARSQNARPRVKGSESSASLFKRISTSFSESPVAEPDLVPDFDPLDGPSQEDINLYVMMANTIAAHQNDEVFLQDWAIVQLAGAPKSEKRWAALTMSCLILFKPYEIGTPPSPTDPKDVFDIGSITEIEYGQHSEQEFALGTPMGMLTFTMVSRKKRDQWVAELRRIIPLVKQEAGRVLKMSAQEARRMIDQMTKQLEEAAVKLKAYEAELQANKERIHQLENVELEKLKKKASRYRAALKKAEQSDKEHLEQLESLQLSTRQTMETLGSSHSTEMEKCQAILDGERRAHQDALKALEQKHHHATEALAEQHAKVVRQLDNKLEQANKQIAEVQQQHEAALKEVRTKHQVELESLQTQQHATVATLESRIQLANKQLAEERHKHDHTVQSLTSHHERSLEELKVSHAAMLQTAQEQLGKDKNEVLVALQAEQQQLEEKYQSELREWQGKVSTLETQHRAEVHDLTTKIALLEERHRSELAHCHQEHAAAVQLLTEQREATLVAAVQQQQEALAALTQQHASALQTAAEAAAAEHRQAIAALQAEYQTKLEQLTHDHQDQLRQKERLLVELSDSKDQLAAQLASVREESANNAVELQSTIEDLRQQLVDTQLMGEKTQKKVQKSLHEEKLRHADELREVKKMLETTHASEISQLHQQLGRTQGAVVQELTTQIELLKSELTKCQAQADQQNSEILSLQAQVESQQEENQQLQASTAATIKQLQEEHAAVLHKSEAALQTLKAEHASTLAHAQRQFGTTQEELQTLQATHETELASLRSAHAEETAALRASLAEQQAAAQSREKGFQAQLDDAAETLHKKLAAKRTKIAELKQQLEQLKRTQEEQLLLFQIAQKSQHEIRKLFFAKHSWDEQQHLLDAKKLFKMFQDSDSFRLDNVSNHKLLESTIENIVDVLEQNQKNLPLLMFYLSFTLTLLDLIQQDLQSPSLVSAAGLRSLMALSPGSTSSSQAPYLSWRQRHADEDVKAWFVEQLAQIAWHLIFQFFLPTVYSHLDEISVVSILFSEQYAIFEGSLSSKTPGEEVTSYLSDVIASIESNHIYLVVAEELLRRIFYRIESQVFNTLLESNREDVVTTRRGFQIKMALSEIDSWIQQSNASGTLLGAAIFNIARAQLLHIRAACMVLVTATNEEMFKDPSIVKDMFKPLTFTQIHRLLMRYRPDRSSPEPIPPSVMNLFAELAKQDSPNLSSLLPTQLSTMDE